MEYGWFCFYKFKSAYNLVDIQCTYSYNNCLVHIKKTAYVLYQKHGFKSFPQSILY